MEAASIDQPEPGRDAARGPDRRLRLLVGLFVALVACTQVGSITAPTLVNSHPQLLLGLSSRIRHLLFAVAKGINPIAYSIVGFVRISAAGWLCYTLGYHYGDRGFRWLESQSGDRPPAALSWLQKAADRAGWLLVVAMPGSNIVCVLVGQRRMSKQRFGAMLTLGVAFRLVWVWVAARQFESELKRALEWIEKYQWWLVIGFLALSFLQSARKASRNVSASQPKDRLR